MDVVEPYHSDPVLRQFGRVKYIPSPPMEPTKCLRGAKPNQYHVDYLYIVIFWSRWENYLLSDRFRSREVAFSRECILEYMQWYLQVSHPYVQNPDSRFTYDIGQSSHTSASLVLDDPRLVGVLGHLEPMVDHDSGSRPSYDNLYHVVQESVHLIHDLRLDPPDTAQYTTTPSTSERCTFRNFFRRKCHNSEN